LINYYLLSIIANLFKDIKVVLMYALIKTGGKQFKVSEGQLLKVEKLSAEVGKSYSIDNVLSVIDGEKVTIGTPLVKGAVVTTTVVSHGRGDKVKIFKMNRRKHYKKSQGHRQSFTEIKIDKITVK
jgi:large subunit ribosomal protein L21